LQNEEADLIYLDVSRILYESVT